MISLESGLVEKRLRRGIEPSTIFSLAFSPEGAWLLCCGSTGTIHLFYNESKEKEPKEPKNPLPRGNSVFGKLIPYFAQEGSFGQSRLEERNAYTELVFVKQGESDILPKMIGVSTSGTFYQGKVPHAPGFFEIKASKMDEPWLLEKITS